MLFRSSASTASGSMPGGFPGSSTADSAATAGGSGVTTAAAGRESSGTRFEVDNALPATRVQIRLADGSRLTARMNLSHRIRDLRGFVDACVYVFSPLSSSRVVVDLQHAVRLHYLRETDVQSLGPHQAMPHVRIPSIRRILQ